MRLKKQWCILRSPSDIDRVGRYLFNDSKADLELPIRLIRIAKDNFIKSSNNLYFWMIRFYPEY